MPETWKEYPLLLSYRTDSCIQLFLAQESVTFIFTSNILTENRDPVSFSETLRLVDSAITQPN